jgi:hypothetical protein
MRERLADIRHPDLSEYTQLVGAGLDRARDMLMQLNKGGDAFAQAHARRFVDLLAHCAQAALMLSEAQWELDQKLPTSKPDIIAHFVNKRLHPAYDPLADEGYLSRIENLMMAVQ